MFVLKNVPSNRDYKDIYNLPTINLSTTLSFFKSSYFLIFSIYGYCSDTNNYRQYAMTTLHVHVCKIDCDDAYKQNDVRFECLDPFMFAVICSAFTSKWPLFCMYKYLTQVWLLMNLCSCKFCTYTVHYMYIHI